MSFFDPGNLFGGGGPGRDPLGIFNRGGGPMSQQQQLMRQTMGNQRFDNQGPAFGGAGFGGGEREIQPMAQPPAWGGGKSPLRSGGGTQQMMDAVAPQGGGMRAAVMPGGFFMDELWSPQGGGMQSPGLSGAGLGAISGGLQAGMAPQGGFRGLAPRNIPQNPQALAQGLQAYGRMRRSRGP